MKKTKVKRTVAFLLLGVMLVTAIPKFRVNAQTGEISDNPYPTGENVMGKIAVSKTATFFLSGMGNIIAKGNITKGSEAETHSANLTKPTKITFQEDEEIKQIESGHHHQLILTTQGRVYAIGNNEYGQLGNNKECEYSEVPVLVAGLNDIVDISADGNQSFALKRDGTLYGWGRNQYYQICSSGVNVEAPMEIATNVIDVEAGVYATYYIDKSCNLYSKGFGTTGLLGYDYYGSNPDFTYVKSYVYKVSAGINHVIIWHGSEELSMWGVNDYDQVIETNHPFHDPSGMPISKIGAEGNSSYVIYENGDAYVWGDNCYGQLGIDHFGNIEPTLLNEYLDNSKIYDLAIGEFHSMALTDKGLYLFGRNVYNQVSSESKSEIYAPLNVTEAYIKDFGYKYEYDKNKAYYILGENEEPDFIYPFNNVNKTTGAVKEITEDFIITDETGNAVNPEECISQAEEKATLIFYGKDNITFFKCLQDISILNGKNIKCDIFVKRYSKKIETGLGDMYYTDNTNMYVWGNNTKGQLGIDVETSPNYPVKAYTDISGTIVDIKSGYYHTLVLTKDGKVYSAGQNTYGQLGTGTNEDTGSFIPVNALNGYKVTDIAANGYQSYAVTVDNRVFAWGRNNYNQIGNGTTSDANSPVEITDKFETEIIKIESGEYCAFAIDKNGNAYAWGYNTNGNLGDTTLTRRREPVRILNNLIIKEISAGKQHAIAQTTAGELYVWGKNDFGQLGTEGASVCSTPVNITNLFDSGVYKFLAKGSSSMVVTDENTLYVFGDNSKGQLGLGSTENVLTPQEIIINGIISDIALSGYNSMLLTDDGKILISGNNSYGQFGVSGTRGSYTYTDITGNFKGVLRDDDSCVQIVVSNTYGNIFNIYITALNMQNINSKVFKVTYDPQRVILTDGCITTVNEETEPGKAGETNISIISHSEGVLTFKYDYELEPGIALSGWVNGLRFKGAKDAVSEIELEVIEEE